MKSLACFAAMLCVWAGFNRPAEAGPHTATTLNVTPRSTLLLNGSSNVTRWRCSGSTLAGAMKVAAPLHQINEVIDRIEDGQVSALLAHPETAKIPEPEFDLTIPIDALRCSGGRPMERDVLAALKAIQYPDITVHFRQVRSGVEHDIDTHEYRIPVLADISLAGVTREVEVTIVAERIDRESFRIRADVPLKMTDFGIRPPQALFGLIKAADRLTVSLSLILEPDRG